MWYAVIDQSGALVSIGTVVADSLPAGCTIIELGPDRPTGQWNATTQAFDPPPPPPRWITKLAFDNRFTEAERTGLELASLDNPAAPMEARALAATLRTHQRQVDRAQYIDLDRADTRAGMQMLEAAGLLAQGRALQILDGPVLPHEVYGG